MGKLGKDLDTAAGEIQKERKAHREWEKNLDRLNKRRRFLHKELQKRLQSSSAFQELVEFSQLEIFLKVFNGFIKKPQSFTTYSEPLKFLFLFL